MARWNWVAAWGGTEKLYKEQAANMIQVANWKVERQTTL